MKKSILELIGNTPLVKVNRIDTGKCSLWLKMENTNPGGSIKDRIGLSMILEAEASGHIKPGSVLVEATAGNTGLGLALVAIAKGYKLILVVPDKMSREKIFHLKAMGVEVVLTRSDVNKGHPEYYQDLAEQITRHTPGAYYINQFNNPANPLAHEKTTGPEIFEQLKGAVDAIVVGIGSSGTLTGLTHYFQKFKPDVEMIIADPAGSVIKDFVTKGCFGEAGSWFVEGIGEDFIPPIADFSMVKGAYTITDEESFETARELLKTEGILAGSSSGTLIAAAIKYCREQKTVRNVVTFVCDSGNKYLTKMYNDFWLRDNGLIKSEQVGDITDIISRNYEKNEIVSLKPGNTLKDAYKSMRTYDISQMPVIENEKIIGIIDESDILNALVNRKDSLCSAVKDYMTSNLVILTPKAKIMDLMNVFSSGMVPIICDDGDFKGLITRIDLINYLNLSIS
jgi:cystathionine beta-synthase